MKLPLKSHHDSLQLHLFPVQSNPILDPEGQETNHGPTRRMMGLGECDRRLTNVNLRKCLEAARANCWETCQGMPVLQVPYHLSHIQIGGKLTFLYTSTIAALLQSELRADARLV